MEVRYAAPPPDQGKELQFLRRGLGGYAATHVEGTTEVLRLAEVFVTLALTSFL